MKKTLAIKANKKEGSRILGPQKTSSQLFRNAVKTKSLFFFSLLAKFITKFNKNGRNEVKKQK